MAADSLWFVCHTRPRCEKKFATLLIAEQCEHYLPLVDSVRRYGTRTKTFRKPLFPGYVFVCVGADRKSRLYQQDLLARIIAVDDVPRFLRQLEDVKAIIASGYELCVKPLLAKGRRARIVGGPLHGLEGVVDDPSHPQGIVLAVDVLRQGLQVKVPAGQLQPLP